MFTHLRSSKLMSCTPHSYSLPLSIPVSITLFLVIVLLCTRSALDVLNMIKDCHSHLEAYTTFNSSLARDYAKHLIFAQWYATKNQGITNTLSMFDFTFSFQIFSSLPFFFLMMQASLILKLCHSFSLTLCFAFLNQNSFWVLTLLWPFSKRLKDLAKSFVINWLRSISVCLFSIQFADSPFCS